MNRTTILRILGGVAVAAATVLILSDLVWVRAHLGGADSQLQLAHAYATGNAVERDEETATAWYRRAAEQGDVRGQLVLAIRYDVGQGVEADPVVATDWFQRAAVSGSAEAAVALAQRYYQGRGVPQDNVRSAAWLILAGSYVPSRADAMQTFEVLKEELSESELAEARTIAKDWRLANPVEVRPILSQRAAAAREPAPAPEP